MAEMITWSPGVTLDAMEEQIIKKAYAHYRDKTVTANALGIARRTLDYKFEKYAEDEKRQAQLLEEKKVRDAEFLMRARGIVPVMPVNPPAPSISVDQVTSLKTKKAR